MFEFFYNFILNFPGPTICYEGMEHAEVPAVSSEDGKPETDKLFEVSPNAEKETIVEVDVTGLEPSEKPSLLVPSTDLQTVRKISGFILVLKLFLIEPMWS